MSNDTKMALIMITGGVAGWLTGIAFFSSEGWTLSCLVIGMSGAHLIYRFGFRQNEQ